MTRSLSFLDHANDRWMYAARRSGHVTRPRTAASKLFSRARQATWDVSAGFKVSHAARDWIEVRGFTSSLRAVIRYRGHLLMEMATELKQAIRLLHEQYMSSSSRAKHRSQAASPSLVL